MYVTVTQAAEAVNRSHAYIFKLVSSGRIEGMRSGSKWMVNYDSLLAHFGLTPRPTNVANVVRQVVSAEDILDRTFGIEIEFYNADHYELVAAMANRGIDCHIEGYNHDSRFHWKIVSDSSVHGRNCGELVSPVLRGALGMNQVKLVCEALAETGAKVNKSCGLHVHYGVDDLNVEDFKRVASFYSTNVTLIESFLARSRRDNFYCRVHNSSELSRIASASTVEELTTVRVSGDRYHAVNFQAYTRHGTIEFRQHQGTVEFLKISAWIYFGMAVIRSCKVRVSAWDTLQSMVGELGLSVTTQNYFVSRAHHFAMVS